MMKKLFGPKPTAQEVAKDNAKDLKRTGNSLEREKAKLEREEKQIEAKMKEAAKKGDKLTVQMLAKNLIRNRECQQRFAKQKSNVTSMGYQMKNMATMQKMVESTQVATQAMGAMNSQINVQQLQQTMQQFEMQNTKMEMNDDIISAALDGALDDDAFEDEENEAVDKVIAELNLDIKKQISVSNTALPQTNVVSVSAQETQSAKDDADLEDFRSRLQALGSLS